MSKSSCPSRRRISALTSRHSHRYIERLSFYSCLYHVRPYDMFSRSFRINEHCVRRSLRDDGSFRFEEAKQENQHKILKDRSTFILGNFIITLFLERLRLYLIDNHRIIHIGEDHFKPSITFIEICTFAGVGSQIPIKRDGFIMMTSDRRLYLYDFNLQAQKPIPCVSFQCQLPMKVFDRTFEYYQQNYSLVIHGLTMDNLHMFVVFELWPCWLSYVFIVEPAIFGEDFVKASVTNEFLIILNQNNRCNIYSLKEILSEFTIESNSVSKKPDGILPVNVVIKSRPNVLFSYRSDIAGFHYAISKISSFFAAHFNERCSLSGTDSDEDFIDNQNLDDGVFNKLILLSDVYFASWSGKRILLFDVENSAISVYEIKSNDFKRHLAHLYKIECSPLDGQARELSDQDGLVVNLMHPSFSVDSSKNLPTILIDHYFDGSASLLFVLFEAEHSTAALIRVIEHPTGLNKQNIHFRKHNQSNQMKIQYEFDKILIQELDVHAIFLRVFSFTRCYTGQQKHH